MMSYFIWVISSFVVGSIAKVVAPGEPQEGLIVTGVIGFSGILVATTAAPLLGVASPESFTLVGVAIVVLSAALVLVLCRFFVD